MIFRVHKRVDWEGAKRESANAMPALGGAMRGFGEFSGVQARVKVGGGSGIGIE